MSEQNGFLPKDDDMPTTLSVPKKPKAKKNPTDPHILNVRMTWGQYQELDRDAGANFRSVNQHILWLIEERLKQLRSRP